MRAEFEAIEDAFDKLPTTLTANRLVVVNSGGTALTLSSGGLTLGGDFTTSGASSLTLTTTGVTNVTLPTTGTLATRAGSETLTNKTISGSSNTLTDIANASLANSSITINGSSVSLGGSITVSATAASIAVGATLTGGTSGRILYDNAGALGELATVPVANGGTGAATLTGIVKGNGTSAFTTVTAPTGTIVGTSDAQTLTSKRVDPRVSSTTSASSVTPDISSYDQYCFTAQAVTLTINAPTGTPVDGNKLIFRILDNGTSRTLSWNATYTAIGTTLPTATTAGKMTYVGCIYNAANTRWDVVGVMTQA